MRTKSKLPFIEIHGFMDLKPSKIVNGNEFQEILTNALI